MYPLDSTTNINVVTANSFPIKTKVPTFTVRECVYVCMCVNIEWVWVCVCVCVCACGRGLQAIWSCWGRIVHTHTLVGGDFSNNGGKIGHKFLSTVLYYFSHPSPSPPPSLSLPLCCWNTLPATGNDMTAFHTITTTTIFFLKIPKGFFLSDCCCCCCFSFRTKFHDSQIQFQEYAFVCVCVCV